jgi:hypothetical protein
MWLVPEFVVVGLPHSDKAVIIGGETKILENQAAMVARYFMYDTQQKNDRLRDCGSVRSPRRRGMAGACSHQYEDYVRASCADFGNLPWPARSDFREEDATRQ